MKYVSAYKFKFLYNLYIILPLVKDSKIVIIIEYNYLCLCIDKKMNEKYYTLSVFCNGYKIKYFMSF